MGDRARQPRPSNLPAGLTSFIGRRQELRDVKCQLATTRLLTLTGSGGAGKTRLALQAATEMARGFPDGAWLVLLGSVHDPLLVPQAVFGALRVHDLSAGLSLSSLAEYLAAKRLLLLLDNCEHLLDGCAVLASTLLGSCPGLRVLATSRQALSVTGEVRMVVPPMSLPQPGQELSVEQVLACDAVWLLTERAAAVVPGFAVDAGNAAKVLELCRRLDGIPLALELAAVRLGVLTLDQLNRGLAEELSILGPGNRGAEARQQTLEATIGWSYRLLGEPERLLWARASVFAGGFEEDAAAEVCCDRRLPADQIMAVLGKLVDKSILKRQLRGDGPPRYWLLETLRWYGRQRLREFGEEVVTQKRHFAWMCALGKIAGAWDSRQADVFRRLYQEQDNLWVALGFCLRRPDLTEAGAELARNLLAYWTSRGPLADVRRMLAALIEAAPANSIPHARLLWVAACMALSQNDYDASAALSEESLRIGTETRDVEVVGWSLTLGAMPHWVKGEIAVAAERYESALSLARLMRVEQVELMGLNDVCAISIARGKVDRAIQAGEQCLAMSKDRGEFWVRGYVLNFLAQAHWLRGERSCAEALARESVVCKHAVDDRNGLTIALETLAWIAAERGQHQRTACLLGCAERVRDESTLALIEVFRPQHEQSVAAAVKGLGQAAFDVAFDRGRGMTIDEGVAFATEGEQRPQPAPAARSRPPAALTRRQLEIARLVADGLSNRQIAARLFLSERTVETHITNIMNRLGLSSRVQLSRWMADMAISGTTGARARH